VGAVESESENSYRLEVSRLVEELGLGGRMTFAGARRDMASVMRALDVFVLTSRHEGFGRVVAEAMAVARPVVVSNEGALPELVGAGADGLLAPPGDAAGFARQILRLLGDQELSARLGARAAVAAHQFNVDVIGERVWTRYQTLISRR
jgi:glycosyltransferase involved in cell wall biosynthesis